MKKYKANEKVLLKREMVKDLNKEIVSFLNSEGGTIYIGVKDNGEVIGIDEKLHNELIKKIKSIITKSINKNVRGLTNYFFNEDNVFVIKIREGFEKPYYLSRVGPLDGVYIREGGTKRKASRDEIVFMIKEYSEEKREDKVSPEQDLHFSFLKLYLHESNIDFNEDEFIKIGIKNQNNEFTNLGLLLSDENPIEIKMARYDEELNFRYKKEFSGSLIKIIYFLLQEAEMFNITSAIIPEKGWIRIDTKSFPKDSLKESILNAICHTDYDMPSNIKVEFFDDRARITSPGPIHQLDLKEILKGKRSFRNPKLVAFLHKLGFIKNNGNGIKKIREAYPNHNIRKIITTSTHGFYVDLPDLNYKEN